MRSACMFLIVDSTPKTKQINDQQRLHTLNKKS